MKHRAPIDGRPPRTRAAIAALTLSGVALIGAGVLTQESVPTLPRTSAATVAEPRPPTAPDAGRQFEPAREAAPSPGPAAGEATTGVPLPPPADVGLVLPEAEPVALAIPSIDAESPTLVPLGLTDVGAMEVPQDYDLAGWYRHGPTPGELGPAVIAGHVDSAADGPAVFHRLAELQPGAEVLVRRADGATAVFVVDSVQQYPKDAFPTEEVYGDTHYGALRLITCGGEFDRRSGSYRDNIVVYGHLAEVR